MAAFWPYILFFGLQKHFIASKYFPDLSSFSAPFAGKKCRFVLAISPKDKWPFDCPGKTQYRSISEIEYFPDFWGYVLFGIFSRKIG